MDTTETTLNWTSFRVYLGTLRDVDLTDVFKKNVFFYFKDFEVRKSCWMIFFFSLINVKFEYTKEEIKILKIESDFND